MKATLFKPNVLIIGSTGRNTGKTEFACRIITALAPQREIIGVKVIPVDKEEGDCHRGLDGCGLCSSLRGEYKIIEETAADTEKDTSRMLKAGARKAYLLLVDKCSLEEGIQAMMEMLPDQAMVIIESNTVRKVLDPGLFLVIREFAAGSVKPTCAEVIHLADKVIGFNSLNWDFDPSHVMIQQDAWRLN